jgi:SM-20-related protein
MTPKQILDSFSETLMQDERILSTQERSLLTTLLQHAKAAGGQTPETQRAVQAVIASAVGETVAQRAFSVLGGSIVERILESSPGLSLVNANHQIGEIYVKEAMLGPAPSPTPVDPQGPKGAPMPPGVKVPHKPPHPPMRDPAPPSPAIDPQGPKGIEAPVVDPQAPKGAIDTEIVSRVAVAVAERPTVLPARCVVLDEFLAPQELNNLMDFALEHEADFQTSEVVSPGVEGGLVNYEHRRSRVLMDLGRYQDLIVNRIKTVLSQVLAKLEMEEFSIAEVEAQMTASNDGDFFHFHSDNSNERVSSRYLTFVYFFHREPPGFAGGELRIHDARLEEGRYVSEGSYQTIVPRQNQIVFFPCELMHEITPVKCPSGLFADSRFTLNGWLRR